MSIEEELEIMNENLKTIAVNQAVIYCKLLQLVEEREQADKTD
jgi:hypothetical protein